MAATTVFDDLRDALAAQAFDGAAVGIDLGTTKSCIAVARYELGELVCECQTIDEPLSTSLGSPKARSRCPLSWRRRRDRPSLAMPPSGSRARHASSSTRARSPRPRTRSVCDTPMRARRRDSNRPPRSPDTSSNTCSTLLGWMASRLRTPW